MNNMKMLCKIKKYIYIQFHQLSDTLISLFIPGSPPESILVYRMAYSSDCCSAENVALLVLRIGAWV